MMQQHHHQKLGERSASGLEELIMGCTSADMKEVSISFLTLKSMKLACLQHTWDKKNNKTACLKDKVQREDNPTFLLLKDREIRRLPSLFPTFFGFLAMIATPKINDHLVLSKTKAKTERIKMIITVLF